MALDGSDRLRILIVDDDEVDRMAVRRALRTIEMDVDTVEAPDLATAREYLDNELFDCVVSDFNLPDGEGRDLLEYTRDHGEPVPMIMLTGVGDEGLAVELMKLGARDYIPKAQLSPARLAQSLRHVVEVSRAEREMRRARRAQQFLVDVSAQLAQSLDHESTLKHIARLAVPEMADYAHLHLVQEDGGVRRAASAHVDPAWQERLTPGHVVTEGGGNPWSPLLDAIRDGEPVFVPAVDEAWLDRVAQDEDHRTLLKELGPRSLVVLPLLARGRTLGTLTLAWSRSGRSFDANDLPVLQNLASRAALAMDNARLYQDLREEVSLVDTLRRLGETITAELKLEPVVRAVTERATLLTGAELGGFFFNFETKGGPSYRLYTRSASGADGFADLPLPGPTSVFGPTSRGEGPVRLADVGEDDRYRTVASHFGAQDERRPMRSYLAVPVVLSDGDVIGGLFFGHPDPGVFTERDERIVMGIASWAAVAVQNARLYEGAQRAARARDEMLAVVSHDLRNPLNVIATSASLILEIPLPEEKKTLQLETIRRTTDRMNRLIQDLLDVTGIEAGKLSIRPEPESAREIITEACDMMTPLTEERDIAMECALPDESIVIEVDRERVLQVFGNLIGNAIKFTPRGGTIEVGCGEDGEGDVLFWVADEGPGVPEEEVPHLFDRFWRGKQRPESGSGLGLPIARGIIEVHGGRIWVDTEEGEGARFSFTVPRAKDED